MSSFTVRPSNSEKEVFRVKLTAPSLLSLKLKPGDLVLLQIPNDKEDTPKPAIAWENSGSGMKDTIVQTSKALQELHGFKLGDRVSIVRSTEELKDAGVVVVKSGVALSSQEQSLWQGFLSAIVPSKHDVLAPGQKLMVEVGNKRGEFEVVNVGGLLGRITDSTQFTFDSSNRQSERSTPSGLQLDFTGIGGLKHEIDQIKEHIDLLMDTRIKGQWSEFRAHQGILLYGPKGTGKTLLQESLSKSSWGSVIRWTPGFRLPTLILPRLFIIDLFDVTSSQKGTAELLELFRDFRGTPTLFVGETRHPNNISERLRSTETFSVELEIPIPDQDKRFDILKARRNKSDQPSDEQLSDLAARTHGFVGADLNKLLHKLWISASSRTLDASNNMNGEGQSSTNNNIQTGTLDSIQITQHDIETSLSQVRPSALQEVFLEKPNTRWTDIGGQHALKHRLTAAVDRTLSPVLRKRMTNLRLNPPKGILLYGPPGCSKTLLAKALATEAKLNFLAIKGAELISMYVGESERATREVFRKARAAAPSILFFDEIDAIASRKNPSGSGGGGDLNVLTTLLNEMDGFEVLKDVLVIAATNKPWVIDVALLRPGRFDYVVYVGLPDVETRREIFEKRFHGFADEIKGRIRDWAERTEGYSGAEIVGICTSASESALDADRDEIVVADVEKAISTASRGITRETLDEYEVWNKSRSATAGS